MAGTKAGARKATLTKLKKNPNYFSEISKGKEKVRKRSFDRDLSLARKAGAKGGSMSKRGKAKTINRKPKKVYSLSDHPLHYEDMNGKPDKSRSVK
jgi:uncharacterized protein